MENSYCWCGHLSEGHVAAIGKDKPVCAGLQPPNDIDDTCKCDRFVPAEVAAFRMLDACHAQILDFKMLYALVNKVVGQEKRVISLDDVREKSN